jgi:hypothetical protein
MQLVVCPGVFLLSLFLTSRSLPFSQTIILSFGVIRIALPTTRYPRKASFAEPTRPRGDCSRIPFPLKLQLLLVIIPFPMEVLPSRMSTQITFGLPFSLPIRLLLVTIFFPMELQLLSVVFHFPLELQRLVVMIPLELISLVFPISFLPYFQEFLVSLPMRLGLLFRVAKTMGAWSGHGTPGPSMNSTCAFAFPASLPMTLCLLFSVSVKMGT